MSNNKNKVWKIERNSEGLKCVINTGFDNDKNSIYNYHHMTPIVLCPQNETSTFILSSIKNSEDLKLILSDLRVVDGEFLFGFSIIIRGKHDILAKLRNDMINAADQNNCVGIGYLFRKLYQSGIKTMYADKVLRRKENSTLRNSLDVIACTHGYQ